MMEMELIQVMFVFMITMDLHGCKLEQILMEKQIPTVVACHSLYPLTAQ